MKSKKVNEDEGNIIEKAESLFAQLQSLLNNKQNMMQKMKKKKKKKRKKKK